VQHGVLLVTTDHPAWAQELSLRRKELVEEINRRVGARVLEDIRFIVGGSGEE
jgi:predicted nucleic acid-binding Zn ribbon protein